MSIVDHAVGTVAAVAGRVWLIKQQKHVSPQETILLKKKIIKH